MITDTEVRRLEKTRVFFTEKGVKVDSDAYNVMDDVFVRWVLSKLGTMNSSNRLGFRLMILDYLDEQEV